MIEYKGYLGKVEFDSEAGLIHGEVINTRDVITFQGRSVDELTRAFRDSVQDYLAFCTERGEDPEKPFSGQFVTRISPELHRQARIAAAVSGMSLNAWVAEQLQNAVRQAAATRTRPAKAKRRRTRAESPSRTRKPKPGRVNGKPV